MKLVLRRLRLRLGQACQSVPAWPSLAQASRSANESLGEGRLGAQGPPRAASLIYG